MKVETENTLCSKLSSLRLEIDNSFSDLAPLEAELNAKDVRLEKFSKEVAIIEAETEAAKAEDQKIQELLSRSSLQFVDDVILRTQSMAVGQYMTTLLTEQIRLLNQEKALNREYKATRESEWNPRGAH